MLDIDCYLSTLNGNKIIFEDKHLQLIPSDNIPSINNCKKNILVQIINYLSEDQKLTG